MEEKSTLETPEQVVNPTIIEVITNGPLRVLGPLEVKLADGTMVSGPRTTFCRCGASANKPFCDGAHKELPPFETA
jgi:hypothetical protein